MEHVPHIHGFKPLPHLVRNLPFSQQNRVDIKSFNPYRSASDYIMDPTSSIDAVETPTAFSLTQDQQDEFLSLCSQHVSNPDLCPESALDNFIRVEQNGPAYIEITKGVHPVHYPCPYDRVVEAAVIKANIALLQFAISKGGVGTKLTLTSIMKARSFGKNDYVTLDALFSNPKIPFDVGPTEWKYSWHEMLMIAATHDKIPFVELYLRHRPEDFDTKPVPHQDFRHHLPFIVEVASIAMADLFLLHGAFLNAASIVARAARFGSSDMVTFLLRAGADPNELDDVYKPPYSKKDYHMGSALNEAIEKKHDNIIEVLLPWGANVNLKDSKGRKPLKCAKERGDDKIIDLLREWGATN